jgi:hypothetical protein
MQSLLLQVPGEKRQHGLLGSLRLLAPEAVPGPLQGQQFRLDARRLQPVDQPDGLLVGHVLVLRAVDAQRRGGVGGHPGQRAGPDVLPPGRLQVAAQEQGQHLGRVHALAVGLREVARPVEIDHAGDRAGLAGVAARPLELLDACRHAEGLGEVPARRAAGDLDAGGVDAILGGVGTDPADGRLHVVDGCGEAVLGARR